VSVGVSVGGCAWCAEFLAGSEQVLWWVCSCDETVLRPVTASERKRLVIRPKVELGLSVCE